MNKKSIEDRFSIDMDTYLNGTKSESQLKSEEYNELLELGKKLVDNDFSKDSNKKAVFNKTLENINEFKGDNTMKKSNKSKRLTTVAASLTVACVVSVSLTQTSFGQDLVDKVIKRISLGHISAVQVDSSYVSSERLIKGKILDEDGKLVGEFSKEYKGKYYTEDGKEIDITDGNYTITDEKGGQYSIKVGQKTDFEDLDVADEQTLVIKDPKELNKYTCFNVILPSYLPEGYNFYKAEFYKDENGDVKDTKYVSLYFANEKEGKYIFMQQRFADEETGFEMGMDDTTEKIKINGVDAIIDDRSIHWEANDAIYSILGRGHLDKKELIKMAESIN